MCARQVCALYSPTVELPPPRIRSHLPTRSHYRYHVASPPCSPIRNPALPLSQNPPGSQVSQTKLRTSGSLRCAPLKAVPWTSCVGSANFPFVVLVVEF